MKFRPLWKCWTCGATLDSGDLLDCARCRAWLEAEIDRARIPLYGITAADIDARLERIA